MSKTKLDDLDAVRTVINVLQGFEQTEQQRILRWVQEKLGLSEIASTRAHVGSPASPATNNQVDAGPGTTARPPDIKTFVDFKNPQTDVQFTAAVAYYYRFEAPEPQRKLLITSADLQEACRQAGRPRFKNPTQTLINAHHLGYLDKGGERGTYVVNTVGENLVAMALPEAASARQTGRRKGSQARKKAKGVEKRTKRES